MKHPIMTFERRGFLACAMAFSAFGTAKAALLPVPASQQIRFKIYRDGTAIGEQIMTFTQDGTTLKVNSQAELVVRIADIPVFHYKAEINEYWQNGRFHRLDSKVNHNGEHLVVQANPIEGGFAVQSTKAGDYQYTGTPKMMPMTYWNKAMLDSMILNIETGHHYPAIVKSPGWNWLPTVQGGKILAQRFDVTGKLHFSVWYDQQDQWAGLTFDVDGHEVFQKYSD